jgi:dephospho-CoA kinase
MLKRGEGRDPQSYEQFLRQDAAEEELFHIQSAVPRADSSLANDGTLDDLHAEIDRLVAGKELLSN